MTQLREGILELEGKEGQSEAAMLLRKQYHRMRGMLGEGEQSEIPRSEAFFWPGSLGNLVLIQEFLPDYSIALCIYTGLYLGSS